MLTALALVAALAAQSDVQRTAPAPAQPAAAAQDGPIATAVARPESASEIRLREALAYSNPLPRGAPSQDYPLVAWCDALVSGHVRLGETLTDHAPEDLEIMRLGRLEAADFRSALAAAEPRQSVATKAAARDAAAAAAARWTSLIAQPDEAARSQSFGLFFGLPGRCEHAARRIRANITTPPATLDEVGLRSEGVDPVQ